MLFFIKSLLYTLIPFIWYVWGQNLTAISQVTSRDVPVTSPVTSLEQLFASKLTKKYLSD